VVEKFDSLELLLLRSLRCWDPRKLPCRTSSLMVTSASCFLRRLRGADVNSGGSS